MINLPATKTGRQKTQVLNYNYTNKPKIRTVIIIIIIIIINVHILLELLKVTMIIMIFFS